MEEKQRILLITETHKIKEIQNIQITSLKDDIEDYDNED